MEELPEITEEEFDKADQGLIPWTASGLREAFEFAFTLSTIDEDELPKELVELAESPEWEEAMKGIAAPDPIEFAKFMMIAARYVDEGQLAAFAYHIRLIRASEFLAENIDELVKLGLLNESPGEGESEVSDGLLEALATLPFSQTSTEDSETVYGFSFQEVVAKAREGKRRKADRTSRRK